MNVRVNLYRVSGRGRDDLYEEIVNSQKIGTVFELDGNTYQIAEVKTERDNFVFGRFRRLQETDVPNIGTKTGNDRKLAKGEGLSHRAFFLFDPARMVLLWLSSAHTCGPSWLKNIVSVNGCKISLAVYLDQDSFRAARASRNNLTSMRVAISTDFGASIGVSITDELIKKAEEMEPDVIELELKVRHEKSNQRALNKIWTVVEGLFKSREKTPGAIRKLKVETFDPNTGEFAALDLLRGRKFVDLDSALPVQQLQPAMAYDLLRSAHTQTFG